MSNVTGKSYTAASFFSGIGGIDYAFYLLGFDIRLQVEIDEYCQKVLRKHRKRYWKNAKLKKDIRYVRGKTLRHIDVVFGGFPCQDISQAGKQNGITEDTRSGLWFELLRIIREARPKIILLENVDNISNVGGTTVTASLAQAGYDCIWHDFQAADIGAPHKRQRWFCIAIPNARCLRLHQSTSSKRRKRSHHKKRNRSPKKQQRRNFLCSFVSSHQILHTKAGLAYSNRQRRAKSRKHRAKARKRFIRTGKALQRYAYIRTKSNMGRNGFDGITSKLDEHRGRWAAGPNESQHDYEACRLIEEYPNRKDQIKALGNAVVPQQVLPFVLTIKKYLDRTY